MDSKSYLRKYGWKPGSGLHGEKGIQKPILVAHKSDVLGLGNKKHNHADHWWERAFDSSLKTLSVDTSSGAGDVMVKQTDQSGALALLVTKGVAKDLSWEGTQSPLYRHFVKGALLEGTFKPEEARSDESSTDSEQSADTPVEYKSKKRKREDDEVKDSKKKSKSKSKSKSSKSKSKDKSEKKRKEKKSSRVEELAIGEELKEKAPSDSGIEITSEPDEQAKAKAKKNKKGEKRERKEKSKEKSKEKKDKDQSKESKEKSKDKSRKEKKKK